MYQNSPYLLLWFFLFLEITSSTTVTINSQPTSTAPSLSPSFVSVDSSPSLASSVQSSSQSSYAVVAVSTSIPPAEFTESIASSSAPLSVTPSPSSTAVILPSSFPPSSPSLSSPGGDVSPTSTVQATGVSSASLPSSPSISSSDHVSPTSTVQATEKNNSPNLKIVGLVVAYIVAVVSVLAILFLVSRMNPEKWRWSAAAAQTAWAEVGITHQTFVDDFEKTTTTHNVVLERESVVSETNFANTAF